ncbi:MAG: aminotransferase [Caldiserica bacterium]|nr:MAG: aminotransferase [Caldisericota bacterium]
MKNPLRKVRLLTPGPTPVSTDILLSLAKEVIHHRGDEFKEILVECTNLLKYVFKTENDVFILTSSGTGAMEGAIVNVLSQGDRAIVLNTGAFGRRWKNILDSYGIEVKEIEYEWGDYVKLEDLEKILKEDPNYQAIFCQHTETSTGVINDIKGIKEVAKKYGDIPVIVDAVSSLLGEELFMDDWELDIVVSGSQKGLMLPPGLAFIAVNKKMWKRIESSKLPKFYFSLIHAKNYFERGQTPWTPAVNTIFALKEGLKRIKEYGIENLWARYKKLAQATREGVKAIGLELFAKRPCNVVTSIKVPEGVDGIRIVKDMQKDFGVRIAGGQREYKGKIVRFAHMGYIDEMDVVMGIAGLELTLSKLGYKFEIGNGVRKVLEVFNG